MSRKPIIYQIVGYKNTGKTTLVCKLIEWFTARGMMVGTVKHDAHNFNIDTPGTDTWKHREAGAKTIAITSDCRTAVIKEMPTSLDQLLVQVLGVDIVLVEGFKQENYPKILMIRSEEDLTLLKQANHITALASWITLLNRDEPVHHVDDIEAIANRILTSCEGAAK